MSDTKLAVVLRDGLEPWQIANVAVFVASGVTHAHPDLVGESYEDADGTEYLRMLGVPAQVLVGDAAVLDRCLQRCVDRGLDAAVYVEGMFATMDDEENRAVVRASSRDDLALVGIATVGPSRQVDRALDRARRHP